MSARTLSVALALFLSSVAVVGPAAAQSRSFGDKGEKGSGGPFNGGTSGGPVSPAGPVTQGPFAPAGSPGPGGPQSPARPGSPVTKGPFTSAPTSPDPKAGEGLGRKISRVIYTYTGVKALVGWIGSFFAKSPPALPAPTAILPTDGAGSNVTRTAVTAAGKTTTPDVTKTTKSHSTSAGHPR